MALFDSEFLRRLEYLSLVSRRVFRGKLLAQRRTKQLGGGIEFADHREYTPGDDLRYLDWNIYARYGDVLLKRFQEEEDLHVYILLDVSQSMSIASQEKFDYARRIAAALAYIALADMDRVSIYAYADEVKDILPITRGKDRILSVLRFLERLEPSGESTRLKHVASALVQRAQRTGLAIVISDLYDQQGFRDGVDLLRYRRFEPHLIQLHTVEEANPTWLGDLELRDIETGDTRKVTISERKLKQYREVFAEFLHSIDAYCRTYSLSCTRSTIDLPFDELILRMMRAAGVTA
ncbi:DUF58 domain-containing protein [Aeoliella sp. ICT_H6.2]|uniref:DUF58 domain-containing protein n=1 Tax=Aeoliella straminimaris TaxID=2954799 RepID=A0A9X2JIB5_9BACT|nr:DUF58 domain-containing protein [Aeoliella straminimaris]MCO6045538.1 DUF58 domain-containing protein [Aeoliella straminimaris]